MSEHIGQNIKALREQKGYSLEAFAAAIGASKSYLWTLEQGGCVPTVTKLKDIADGLGVTLSYFLEGQSLNDAIDENFYKTYLNMDRKTKIKLRAIANILKQTGGEDEI